jgi:hypothetical protein
MNTVVVVTLVALQRLGELIYAARNTRQLKQRCKSPTSMRWFSRR